MTPKQFHYPLFFDLQEVNLCLKPYGWQGFIRKQEDDQESAEVVIRKRDDRRDGLGDHGEIKLTSYEFIMVKGNWLYIWKKFSEGLEVRQYNLTASHIHTTMKEEFISIEPLIVGQQKRETSLVFDHFVTFIRKPNLPQGEPDFEQYVVLHYHQDQLTVIPMDEFNRTGGDPMYVWPVLASFEPQTGILYGLGMRMGAFSIRLALKASD